MSEARWSGVAAAADAAVELVMSRRGKPKAKYAGRTFTLDTRSDQRYRWRCDVRQCRSRLTTDLYDNRHMVYRFRDHDEELHRRVASERKRRDATYRQQGRPAKKIGDYRYVLENRIGGLLFWRCEYVSCPGRCRTHDGHLVAGPSQHSHQPNAAVDDPAKVHGAEEPSSYSELQLDACQKVPPGASEAITTDTDSKHGDVPEQQREHESCSPIPSGRVDSPVVIKSEPCSPKTPEAVATSYVSAYAETTLQTRGPDVIADVPTAEDDGLLFQASTPYGCPDQRSSLQAEYDQTVATVAATAPEDSHYVDSSDYDGNDEEVEWPPRPGGAPPISEEMEERSHLGYGAGYGLSAGVGGHRSGLAEVLQMTADSVDSRERDLRVDILLQMRSLLEAETELVNQKRRNEILRGKLLRRELLGVVPESEPAPPYI
ncbi:uncharacterized protein LOC119396694 [Rhipicephalus sanguineus]|uniref:FLYWCH-type domain-containing protein n=1 Tax=Rhipicephalus sanguineus TaxID=34632 RepID=A0A9D4PPI4_RHISA|nr:uncharacterized protein LOC119396694 [Rhipicephalus sanguineus]KAH7947801.1 hypothetical protein HPB52_015931 [Rhipicephalus sanguineus]